MGFLAAKMAEAGWEVHVFTGVPSYPYTRVLEGYQNGKRIWRESYKGCQLYRYPLQPAHRNGFLGRLQNVLGLMRWPWQSRNLLTEIRPDWVLVQSPPPTLAWVVHFICQKAGLRCLVNVSDLWQEVLPHLDIPLKPTVRWLVNGLENQIFRKNHSFLAQSQEIEHYLKQRNKQAEVFLYRNGVQPAFLRALTNPKIEIQDVKTLKVLYVGLLGMAQGLLNLCQNVDFAAQNAALHIYGEGVERSAVAELANARTDIHLHDSVQHTEIPNLLRQHDILLVSLRAYLYGTVPSKIYEGIAAGLPIIFLGEGEGATLVKENEAGWVLRPKDYQGLEDLLKGLSPKKLREASDKKAALKTLNAALDAEVIVASFLLWLKKLPYKKET